MQSPSSVRAGRAFVELFADDKRLVRGLKTASAKLKAWGASVTAIGRSMFTGGAAALGALAGAGVLAAIFNLGGIKDMTGGYGSNGLSGVNGSAGAGILVEVVLTFIFVMVILGVTSKKAAHGSFGGLIIGLTLVLVHILGIGLTGTSVNPARSIGPAVVAALSGNMDPLSAVWIFIVAPLAGAALAAIVYMFLEGGKQQSA